MKKSGIEIILHPKVDFVGLEAIPVSERKNHRIIAQKAVCNRHEIKFNPGNINIIVVAASNNDFRRFISANRIDREQCYFATSAAVLGGLDLVSMTIYVTKNADSKNSAFRVVQNMIKGDGHYTILTEKEQEYGMRSSFIEW